MIINNNNHFICPISYVSVQFLIELKRSSTLSRKSQEPFWAYQGDSLLTSTVSFYGMDDISSKK